jgi:Zn-dependent protease
MILSSLVILFFSVVLHEVAHGLIAERHGDPTARMMGRITLNPLAHIDPVGTIFLPVMTLIISGGRFVFGWAKPVPINPRNLNNPKRDMMWIALSGPATNFGLALFLALIFRLLAQPNTIAEMVLFYGVTINLVLAFMNLIPIPPLDGSRILSGLLPDRYSHLMAQLDRFGFIFLIIFFFFILRLLVPGIMGISFHLIGRIPWGLFR